MIDTVRVSLQSGRRLTIREMTEEAQISMSSCHAIVKEEMGLREWRRNSNPRESLVRSH